MAQIIMAERLSAPDTPASGKVAIYVRNGAYYTKNAAGIETPIQGINGTNGADGLQGPPGADGIDGTDLLGNPATDGMVLSSTTAGVRSWVAMSSGSSSALDTVVLIEGMTGAELETWLGTTENQLAFEAVCNSFVAANQMVSSPDLMTAVAASSTAFAAVLASSTAMAAVLASSTAMTAVAASSTAMTAVAASSTAMTAVAASSTAMTAVAASSTAMTAVAASSTAMAAVIASSTAMTAVAASSTAMAAVAASATALSAMNASATAKTALYNSPIRTRILKAGHSSVVPFMAVSSGSGLFVKAVHAGSFPGYSGLKIDGGYVPASRVATYDVLTRYTTSLGIDWYYDQSELVYIPC